MRKIASLLLVAVLALAVAGCGGDDDEPLSKEDFISQGKAICEEGNTELAADSQELGQNPSPDEIEAFVAESVVPNVQNQADELRELIPPEEDQETIDAMLAALDDGIAAAEDDPSAFAEGGDLFSEANQLANDYGLTVCGS